MSSSETAMENWPNVRTALGKLSEITFTYIHKIFWIKKHIHADKVNNTNKCSLVCHSNVNISLTY